MDELLREIVTASQQRADYVTTAWIQNAALLIAMTARSVLTTPAAFAALGPVPARVAALSEAEQEVVIAQITEAARRLLTQAL